MSAPKWLATALSVATLTVGLAVANAQAFSAEEGTTHTPAECREAIPDEAPVADFGDCVNHRHPTPPQPTMEWRYNTEAVPPGWELRSRAQWIELGVIPDPDADDGDSDDGAAPRTGVLPQDVLVAIGLPNGEGGISLPAPSSDPCAWLDYALTDTVADAHRRYFLFVAVHGENFLDGCPPQGFSFS